MAGKPYALCGMFVCFMVLHQNEIRLLTRPACDASLIHNLAPGNDGANATGRVRDMSTILILILILYYTMLYYTIRYYSILYYTYYTILYYTILCYTILYYTILYYTIL